MTAVSKHIPTTSAAALILYLKGKARDGNDAPRAMYAAGQHCAVGPAIEDFRDLRLEHGRDGEMRKVNGKYRPPDDPAEATHLKIGKNWREAKKNETATHVRIEPEVKYKKSYEAFHFVYSFDLAAINPDDPEACRRGFDAIREFRREQTPGTQSLFIAHGDAKGSRDARETAQGGKFHVHEAMNAIVHSEFELGGRTFKPGDRVGGAVTHVDTYREAFDEFLERRGHEFGLAPQDVSVLPPPGSKQAKAVRRTDHDFWERERGGISDQDRARRGVETALEALSKDPARVAALSQGERMELLADEVAATGDVTLKLRSNAKVGTRLRSLVVPGRKQALTGKQLGSRYSKEGIDEQLEEIAQGRWKPITRGRVTAPPKVLPLATREDDDLIREAVERERAMQAREHELEARVAALKVSDAEHRAAQRAADEEAWAKRDAEQETRLADYRERVDPVIAAQEAELERGLAELDAYLDAAGSLAPETDTVTTVEEPEVTEREEPEVGEESERAQASAPAASVIDLLAQRMQSPQAVRAERQLPMLPASKRRDLELVAVVHGDRDGDVLVDYQLSADDPQASGRPGLHLYARTDERGRSHTTLAYDRGHADRLRRAAGENREVDGGREVLRVRGDLTPHPSGAGYYVPTDSLRSTNPRPLGGGRTLEAQRSSEDRAREQDKAREQGERTSRTEVADRFAQAHERDDDYDLGR